jgi:hypothetical protein
VFYQPYHHQHFHTKVFCELFWRKKIVKKATRKMLVKSITAGVNFTNILRAAFMLAHPKSTKNAVKLSVFFALLGSAPVKAVQKMLAKSMTGVTSYNSFPLFPISSFFALWTDHFQQSFRLKKLGDTFFLSYLELPRRGK